MNTPPKKKSMVGWYAPRQLAKTAVDVAISTIFGRHSDHRIVEAMAAGHYQQEAYDYTCYYLDDGKDLLEPDRAHPRDSIWIDYVGDAGDGWNSTYAIAYYLAGNITVPERRLPGPRPRLSRPAPQRGCYNQTIQPDTAQARSIICPLQVKQQKLSQTTSEQQRWLSARSAPPPSASSTA